MTNPFKADVLVVKLSGKALTADKALDALFAALADSAANRRAYESRIGARRRR